MNLTAIRRIAESPSVTLSGSKTPTIDEKFMLIQKSTVLALLDAVESAMVYVAHEPAVLTEEYYVLCEALDRLEQS